MPHIKDNPLYERMHKRILARIAGPVRFTDASPRQRGVKCSSCGGTTAISETKLVDGDRVCEDCHTVCHLCHDDILQDDCETALSQSRHTTVDLCFRCSNNRTFECDQCGGRFLDPGEIISRADADDMLLCRDCAGSYTWFCDNCDDRHYDADQCPEALCSGDEWQASFYPSHGEISRRFGARLVGLELETGAGGGNDKFAGDVREVLPRWGCSEDASLESVNGMEYISNPMSGDAIESGIDNFYRLVKSYDVDMDWTADNQIGAHVHVEASDIFEMVGLDKPGTMRLLLDWGRGACNLASYFVSRRRASNRFCCAGFQFRDDDDKRGKAWESGIPGDTNGNYPTIAIRSETVEFRIWPGSSSLSRYKARVELSQRLVQLLADALSGREAAVSAINCMTSTPHAAQGGGNPATMRAIIDALGMSDEGAKALAEIASSTHRFVIYPAGTDTEPTHHTATAAEGAA